MHRKLMVSSVLGVLVLTVSCQGLTPPPLETAALSKPEPPTETEPSIPTPTQPQASAPPALPDFIYAVRGYIGGDHEDFQFGGMEAVGFEYLHGLPSFTWETVEPRDDGWKWGWIDEQLAALARYRLKVIPLFLIPKGAECPQPCTAPWMIPRDDPRLRAEYEEFAYEVVKRYSTHPTWSGIVAVWGGSSDVFGEHPWHEPEVQVPLLNAAYDGVKRADPNTIVVSFNMATTISGPEAWEDWHTRAFGLAPKFDWFGVQSHGVPVTYLPGPGSYAGLVGLTNVRRFLDRHGHAEKPIFLNEGGFLFGEDIAGLPEEVHAQQVVETYIVARALDVNLRGWVYFEYFGKSHQPEDFGLMSPVEEADPPQPRQAWYALQTLFKTVGFADYQLDARLSGQYSLPDPPFVYRFVHRSRPDSKLWIVFSPWISKQGPVRAEVTVNIAPATQATRIDMLGNQTTVAADASGNITVTSTGSPIYLNVGD